MSLIERWRQLVTVLVVAGIVLIGWWLLRPIQPAQPAPVARLGPVSIVWPSTYGGNSYAHIEMAIEGAPKPLVCNALVRWIEGRPNLHESDAAYPLVQCYWQDGAAQQTARSRTRAIFPQTEQ